MSKSAVKPLGRKAYGSIPHINGSLRTDKDSMAHISVQNMLTKKVKNVGDRVIVREKVDGSCVGVAKLDNQLVPLIRAGYTANTSPFKMHQMFHIWVYENYERFDKLLQDGERVCGEWLLQAHGIKYRLPHEPFVVFDLFRDNKRIVNSEFEQRCGEAGMVMSTKVASAPITPEEALKILGKGGHGSVDAPEGVVYRYETANNVVTYLAKYVRPDFVPGKYLPELNGGEPVWNELPKPL